MRIRVRVRDRVRVRVRVKHTGFVGQEEARGEARAVGSAEVRGCGAQLREAGRERPRRQRPARKVAHEARVGVEDVARLEGAAHSERAQQRLVHA